VVSNNALPSRVRSPDRPDCCLLTSPPAISTGHGEEIDLMFDLNRERDTTLLLVTHDERLAARCGRRLRLKAETARWPADLEAFPAASCAGRASVRMPRDWRAGELRAGAGLLIAVSSLTTVASLPTAYVRRCLKPPVARADL
jgi:hypothetical protein